MTDSFISVMPASAVQLFISGFIFREFFDIKVVAEYMWVLLVLVSLTISNAILVRNYLSVTGQKTVTHSTQPQVSNDSKVVQQKDISVAARDHIFADKDVPSNEFPNNLLDLSGTYKLESKSNYEGEK
jgi:N-acetyl-gamma-glutamylphosphate reductase